MAKTEGCGYVVKVWRDGIHLVQEGSGRAGGRSFKL